MSPSIARTLTGLVLLIHGLGHAMAFVPALNLVSNENWHARSWLLGGLGDTAGRVVLFILFGAALVGFVAAGLGVLGWIVPHAWWRPLAVGAALVGTVALALYWNAFAVLFPNKIGALAVNLAVLIGLLGTNGLTQWVADI